MAAKLADMQEGVETAFSNVQLDEKTQHEDCPDNVKDALLFKVKSGVSSVSSNANRVFRREGAYDRYDLKDGDAGIDQTVASRPSMEFTKNMNPEDFPELERPPLRKIDKYCQPECPCCSITKRYTQAVLVMFGFIISFGIRCNVGVAPGTVRCPSSCVGHVGTFLVHVDVRLLSFLGNLCHSLDADDWIVSLGCLP